MSSKPEKPVSSKPIPISASPQLLYPRRQRLRPYPRRDLAYLVLLLRPVAHQEPLDIPVPQFGPAPVFEEEENDTKEIPAVSHARRASTAVAGRFAAQPQQTPVLPDAHNERGQGLLRRLSLSSAAFAPSDGKRSPPERATQHRRQPHAAPPL
ncbi:hypothetical protein FB451DRAFT_1440229 [Mycena latifolia]|nr:hypothetical protein FB451DRAFT_1440229 [Mycena latifolia]